MDFPRLNATTRHNWMQIGHSNASNQGQVLWVVIKNNDWLKDGDVDCGTDTST